MTQFILNNKLVMTDMAPGMVLLDLVRYHEHLMGTKIGCREGDCGACTVLIGELSEGRLLYRSATSCLTALGNVEGKHVVTVEGLNSEDLNPLQQAICEEGGTQCGFCTPGFIVSMAGFCLGDKPAIQKNAMAAVDGNICRCTGYKSIERALARVVALLQDKRQDTPMEFLVDRGILPAWFLDIGRRLLALPSPPENSSLPATLLGGGTDLYVQRHETMETDEIGFLFNAHRLKGIAREGNRCVIGGAATVTDLMESPVLQKAFPQFNGFCHLVSSTPIRNIATLAGNFVNASPIGDLSILFLALNARLILNDGDLARTLPLREFFLGYKTLGKKPEEFIEKIVFDLPDQGEHIHFEKVSKRTCLDIASVNSAIRIRIKGDRVEEAHVAAGGVAPIPAYLPKTSAALCGQQLNEGIILAAIRQARAETSPISDVRGTAAYKSLLLGQLIKAHFLTLFPDLRPEKLLEA